MSSPRKTEVVIVGGGGGAALAASLSAARAQFDPAKHNLTLISQLPYGIHLPATARMVTTAEGNLDSTDKAFIPLDKLFKPGNAGRVVQGKVTQVLDDRVVLENGSSVAFDYLVLATGSVWTGTTNFSALTSDEDVHAHVDSWRKKISVARSIVVVGGGAVGLELAAEIKHYHPRTVVTVVHAGDKLLNAAYPDKFRNRAKADLEAIGISVVLGDRVIDIPDEGVIGGESGGPASLRTSNGDTIEADLFIPALGPRPNTAYLTSSGKGAWLSPTRHVYVSPTLNVKSGASSSAQVAYNIFAMGDIIEWNEQHMMLKLAGHAAVITKNLLAAINGTANAKPAEYQSGKEAILITRGPNGGYGYLPFLWGLMPGNWIVSMLKSGHLFVSVGRKACGYA